MLRCAAVGLRNRGRGLVREAEACDDLTVVALCDTDRERLRTAQGDAPAARLEQDAEAVFQADDIDAVILALPNTLHKSFGLKALQAGKHVYMEKPLARDVAECEELMQAEAQSGKTIMVGYQQRFSLAATQARALLAQNAIGTVTSAVARWNRRTAGEFLWERGDWFLDPTISGGGPMIDIGVHKLDLCLDLLGYPAVKHCVAKARYGLGKAAGNKRGKQYAIEDALDAWLFADAIDIRVESSYFRNQDQEEFHDIEIIGTAGGMRINGFNQVSAWLVNEDGAIRHLDIPAVTCCSALAHFADAINGKTALRPDSTQSRDLQKIIDACYASSARASQPVSITETVEKTKEALV